MTQANARHRVHLCGPAVPSTGAKGGHRKHWAFSIADLAKLFGLSEGSTRNLLSRRQAPKTGAVIEPLDPRDLAAVCREWARRNGWTPPPGG